MSGGVWREPAEETVDLYPGLVVHDGRVTGSMTTGRSRLPLWCFVYTAITEGWGEVEDNWKPSEYGWTAERFASFLYDLLEMRGEFARLLLLLANTTRVDDEREQAAMDEQAPGQGVVQIKVFDSDPDDAVTLPPPWWLTPELRDPIVAQLRRCLETLESPSTQLGKEQRGQ